jgi:hypothetical protein
LLYKTDCHISSDIAASEMVASPFQPRWRLRSIPLGVGLSLLAWVMSINLIG